MVPGHCAFLLQNPLTLTHTRHSQTAPFFFFCVFSLGVLTQHARRFHCMLQTPLPTAGPVFIQLTQELGCQNPRSPLRLLPPFLRPPTAPVSSRRWCFPRRSSSVFTVCYQPFLPVAGPVFIQLTRGLGCLNPRSLLHLPLPFLHPPAHHLSFVSAPSVSTPHPPFVPALRSRPPFPPSATMPRITKRRASIADDDKAHQKTRKEEKTIVW
jgi:hypothetical protein